MALKVRNQNSPILTLWRTVHCTAQHCTAVLSLVVGRHIALCTVSWRSTKQMILRDTAILERHVNNLE